MDEKSRPSRKRRKRQHDEDQMTFNFTKGITDLCETVQAMAEVDLDREQAIRSDQTKAEFYIEISAACIRALREANLTRDQAVDRINESWKRSEEEDEGASDRPTLTKPMLDNYLSKPIKSPLPAWLIYAICEITGCLEPLAIQAEKLGGKIINGAEKTELTLGKLETQLRIGALLKREIIKQYGTKVEDKGDGLSD